MSATPRRLRLGLITCLVLLVCLASGLALGGCARIRAGQLVRDATAPGIDLSAQVEEEQRTITGDAGETRVRIYRPVAEDGPLPSFVLCHGAVENGVADQRLVRFAHALAVRGATVVTPELPALARFRIDGAEPARVSDVADWLVQDPTLCEGGRVALLGISVGGAYCLVASREERMRGRLSAILAFGAYDDLERLVFTWMTEPAPAAGLLDPFTEGRRRVLLGNLGSLVDDSDHDAVSSEIRTLLAGRTPSGTGRSVGERARLVLTAARSSAPLDPALARALLAPIDPDLAALSPVRAGTGTDAPVYLLHGSNDPIVPTASVRSLAEALSAAGAPVELHVTDLFEHVDAGSTPSLWDAWPLLGFLGDYLGDAGI